MVAKLVALDGPEKGLELILEKGQKWVIGRDPQSCDFLLEDPKVSREHAQIRFENDHYYIKNLSKTNPVLIDNEPVKRERKLSFDMSLKIGESHFKLVNISFKKKGASSDYDQIFDDLDEPAISIHPLKEEPKESPIEDGNYDTIFQDLGDEGTYGDLSEGYVSSERFILKVLSGPNTGAEFSMQKGRSYIIGTDVTGADIIFNDLSVSRHHARISITDEEEILVEDLDSRNGVAVDGEQITGQKLVSSKNLVSLGTTTFLIVDREAGEETIVTPRATKKPPEEKPTEPEPFEEVLGAKKQHSLKSMITESSFIITGVLIAVILVLGSGAVLLFKTSPVEFPHKDYTKSIQGVLGSEFPDVKFTFTSGVGSLFLVGHVLTTTERDELIYKLDNLSYISQIDNNVVVDEYVSQEMNLILALNPEWQGISVHAPEPGQFVMSGYLPTREDNAELVDYMNLQFPYIDRLTNYVIIEENLYQDVISKLQNYGFYNVSVDLSNGAVTLSGYVNCSFESAFEGVVKDISRIMGVRSVNNYVVIVGKSQSNSGASQEPLTKDPSIVNLTNYVDKQASISASYTISGFAAQGDQGRAAEVNGQILTVGSYLDGMRVIAIEDDFVFLEKNGLKYKVEYLSTRK